MYEHALGLNIQNLVSFTLAPPPTTLYAFPVQSVQLCFQSGQLTLQPFALHLDVVRAFCDSELLCVKG